MLLLLATVSGVIFIIDDIIIIYRLSVFPYMNTLASHSYDFNYLQNCNSQYKHTR